jgi:hypothetical protein
MHLIYSHNYATARTFALRNEFMPGDWKWIQDADIVRQYPRADVYKVTHWEANPHRDTIDEAIARARASHRLGTVSEVDAGGSTLGVSGA